MILDFFFEHIPILKKLPDLEWEKDGDLRGGGERS